MHEGVFVVVFTTCGSLEEAERIAHTIVEQRFAACVNVITAPVRSVYRWKEKIEASSEYILMIKTSAERFQQLADAIGRLHSYEVPEILALPVVLGSDKYLNWMAGELLG